MIIKDFQFVNLFLQEEMKFDYDRSIRVHIIKDDKTDVTLGKGKTIELHSPTLVAKTIFNLIYRLCEDKFTNPYKKDTFSLLLSDNIHEYVYHDDEQFLDGPALMISAAKIPIPTIIIKEGIEPIIDKKLDLIPLLFASCSFTDSCRIIESYTDFFDAYDFQTNLIPYTKYPFILCNRNIENKASLFAHILIRQLEHNLGESVAERVVRKILLNEDDFILGHIVKILYMVEDSVCFVEDFISYLRSYGSLKDEEIESLRTTLGSHYRKHPKLKKYAQLYNEQIQRQWTQWSTMLGLIEKQLEGFRGSKRPTTELMQEIDEAREKIKGRKRKRNRKRTLNMEELLEVYRDQYKSKNTEPGRLFERLLSENRIWC